MKAYVSIHHFTNELKEKGPGIADKEYQNAMRHIHEAMNTEEIT
jgi:hypothetical protein